MKFVEALQLKEGDLVVVNGNRNRRHGGLVLEIESITLGYGDFHYCLVTLKQPGFDGGFRLKDYDSRLLKRY